MYLKHGLSNSPEYKVWQQLKGRCLNPNHRAYPSNGGRGVTFHEAWVRDFPAFLEHVGPRPSPKHALKRVRPDLGFEPGNVKWVAGRGYKQRRSRPKRSSPNFKHGMSNTPEYRAWVAMKNRCLNTRSPDYPRWGGAGITVGQEWVDDFMAFYQEVGPRPSPEHSLDRFPDPSGNYESGNVRWATNRQQNLNRVDHPRGADHGNFRHGHIRTPEYRSWTNAKGRCFNQNHDHYNLYGGRGTTMCQRWRESFEAFLEDLGTRPPGLVLSRRDTSGHYSCGKCPECQENGWLANCQWVTQTEANRIRQRTERTGKLTEFDVVQIRDWLAAGDSDSAVARAFGVASSLVGKIRRGESWA